METREIRTATLPALEAGEIWGTTNLGVFVVVSSRPAQWRGEDADVYGHVNTWYTIRPADEQEQKLWEQAVKAAQARKQQRKILNAEGLVFSESESALCPTPDATRRLDSYDDRWQPPTAVKLTPEQSEIESGYVRSRAALKTQ